MGFCPGPQSKCTGGSCGQGNRSPLESPLTMDVRYSCFLLCNETVHGGGLQPEPWCAHTQEIPGPGRVTYALLALPGRGCSWLGGAEACPQGKFPGRGPQRMTSSLSTAACPLAASPSPLGSPSPLCPPRQGSAPAAVSLHLLVPLSTCTPGTSTWLQTTGPLSFTVHRHRRVLPTALSTVLRFFDSVAFVNAAARMPG